MLPTEYPRFKNVMASMAKVFERELDQPLLDGYWLALADWPVERFEQTAKHLLATCRFMPRPADFNEALKAGRLTASEAFSKALQHVRTSAYRDGLLGINLIDRTIEGCGGYFSLAMTDNDDLQHFERRFSAHYQTLQDAEETRQAIPEVTDAHADQQRLSGPKSNGRDDTKRLQ